MGLISMIMPIVNARSLNRYCSPNARTTFADHKMIIAVNTRVLINDHNKTYGYFLYENLNRITKSHPEHQFIFIFDRPYDKKFSFGGNVKPVVVGPSARHALSWKYWYDIKIPAALKKYKADVFVSCDGLCSLTTNLPQCLVVHDLSFLHDTGLVGKTSLVFYKHFMPKFLKRAMTIVTFSAFSQRQISGEYEIDVAKINVVPVAAREIFHPLSDEDKNSTKINYTDGKEYFVYAGAPHGARNLKRVLKAYSIFKKRQASNLKLVLVGSAPVADKDFIESLKTYKYREDVVLTGQLEDGAFASIIGAAYGLIYPLLHDGIGLPVLESMHCHVPVITCGNSAMEEIAGDAALYINPSDHDDIAEKMMLLYKDEALRSQLIEKGSAIKKQYSLDRSADAFWECIVRMMSQRSEV